MQQKSINLASSTNHNSYIYPAQSTYRQSLPLHHSFNPNAVLNSNLQVPQNYVQVPRGSLIGSVNQQKMFSSSAMQLSNYPIIVKGIVQSQHIPPSSLVRQLPVIRKHPQHDFNPNFDYEQANFLCQAKITEEQIYCPVCNSKFKASQKAKHIQMHIRKPSSVIDPDASSKIKSYYQSLQKSSTFKIRPIVQPEEAFAEFKPNTYKIIQKVLYEDSNINRKQRSIGNQQNQQQVYKTNDMNIFIQPEPNNLLSNYHNSVQQHKYIVEDQPKHYEPVIYVSQEPKLPLISPQVIQLEPSEVFNKPQSYDNSNLQRRSMSTIKTSSINPIQEPNHIFVQEPVRVYKPQPIKIEPVSKIPQPIAKDPQRFAVEPQNYVQVNSGQTEKYPLRRSFAPTPAPVSAPAPVQAPQIINTIQQPQNERFRATLNQNQNDSLNQPVQPASNPQSQAESFSNAQQIQSSKNQLSKNGSQNYFNQFFENNSAEEATYQKKIPYRSQW